ncbi:hypothetical protein CDAR_172831, partial [Caerostris darwini]
MPSAENSSEGLSPRSRNRCGTLKPPKTSGKDAISREFQRRPLSPLKKLLRYAERNLRRR